MPQAEVRFRHQCFLGIDLFFLVQPYDQTQDLVGQLSLGLVQLLQAVEQSEIDG